MWSHRRGRVLLALAGSLLLGCGMVALAPSGLATSVAWPFGAITGCAVWCSLRGRAVVVSLFAVVLLGSYLVAGVGTDAAVTSTVAHVLGVVTTLVVLTARGRPRATLLSEPDITRYVVAAVAGGLVSMAALALRLVFTGTDLGPAVVGFGLQHAASELLLVPFFVRLHVHRGTARRAEWAVQWLIVIVSTAVAFGRPGGGAGMFVVLTALGWGARRLGTWESLGQATGVGLFASLVSLDQRGAFHLVTMSGASGELARTTDNLLLQGFVACIALVVVPLVLTVGVQLDAVHVASHERDRLAGVLDGARGLAIVGTDPWGNVTLFNVGAERLLGYRAEAVLGRPARVLDAPAELESEQDPAPDADRLPGADGRGEPEVPFSRWVREGDGRVGRRVRMRRHDGEVRTFEGSVHAVRDDDGGAVGFVGICEDVSERLMEQRSLEEAVARLQQIDEAKDIFVSSVSHELRTPLASILGYLELLRDGTFGPMTRAQTDALARVGTNGARLLALIDDLLTFSRLGQDTRPIAAEPVDLVQVARAALDVVTPVPGLRDLELHATLPAEAVPLVGDRGLLERLVINLMGNAVKFTPDGGRVTIAVESATAAEAVARLRVVDTGIGIPADELPQLTSRFFRSRGAVRDAIPGTGLGLSISRSIAEAHGGRIVISSIEGSGTTVVVELPTAQLADGDDGRSDAVGMLAGWADGPPAP